MDAQATVDAIEILREITSWSAASSVGQQIRIRAWIRLEREARAMLTGPEPVKAVR